MNIIVSIIVPSYLKSDVLKWFFYSLQKQKIFYDYETIILNDGIKDNTESICLNYQSKLNIKYIFTGQHNKDRLQHRMPGFAFNIGVKRAKGRVLILTQPDIFLLDNCINYMVTPVLNDDNVVTISNGKDDDNRFLKGLRAQNLGSLDLEKTYNSIPKSLNTNLPFFMGLSKNKYNNIGGYDEDFIGYCSDDRDFVDRLDENNSEIIKIDKRVIHLFHPRTTQYRKGLNNISEAREYNRNLYLKKQQERKSKIKPLIPMIPIIETKIEKEIMEISGIDSSLIKKEFTIPKKTPVPIVLDIKPLPIGKKDINENKWYLEKIPKIIHFYWGEKEISYLRYLSIYTFIKYNPDWKVCFYYPKYRSENQSWISHEHSIKIDTKNYYNKLKKLPIEFIEVDFKVLGIENGISEVYKSNFLTWFILSQIGGVFSDTDIIYFNSINKMEINTKENNKIDTVISLLWHGHTMGFLMSSPYNSFFQDVWKKSKKYFNPNNYQSIGTVMLDKEYLTIDIIKQKFPNLNIVSLYPNTIYAYDIGKIKELYQSNDIKWFGKNSIGLHWYGGHKLSGEYVNKIENSKIKTNNVIGKVIKASLHKKSLIVDYTKKLTIHCVIRNEPFIYYAIKAVYPYAKKILLYDTGSYDKYTLTDIQTLLEEDVDNKIIFKQIPIEFDETKWTLDNIKNFIKENKGKFGKGKVRQIMIDDTDTEFFMTVDGDEIHYKETMEQIVNVIIPNLLTKIYCVAIPIEWFYDMNYIFKGIYSYPYTGRVYRTNKVKMSDGSPNEHHIVKPTNQILLPDTPHYNIQKDLKPFAHFENFLKPNRRKHLINEKDIIELEDYLPEVMIENQYYIKRFLEEIKLI